MDPGRRNDNKAKAEEAEGKTPLVKISNISPHNIFFSSLHLRLRLLCCDWCVDSKQVEVTLGLYFLSHQLVFQEAFFQKL